MNSHQYNTQISQYSKTGNHNPRQNTIREKSMSRNRESGALSRASLVHGSAPSATDSWYDVEAFLLDQVKEVLNKLNDGSIDDEIWGKIVVMERCKRVAKAYLRKTTVIVDGSEEEFDGKTLGFNLFDNPERDEMTSEIRSKIGDGVILKMDLQGNVKGMARGCAPVICQGWRGFHSSISERLARQQGRLNGPSVDQEKPFKLFDMKKFKHSLDHELHEVKPDARALMLKTCIRVALVKDGTDMSRTPCWFAVVNLVALDMLKERLPSLLKQVSSECRPPPVQMSSTAGNTLMSSAISQEALQQIIAAAVSQVNQGLSKSMHTLPTAAQEQLTQQIASTLNLSNNINNNTPILKNETINPASAKKIEQSNLIQRRERKKTYHSSRSSLDSSADETVGARAIDPTQIKSARLKRWEPTAGKSIPSDEFYDSGFDKTKEKEKKKPLRTFPAPARPRLQDVFTRSQSITSDYDSNKEQFDSGSWSSSHSRGFPGGRSTSSSVISEAELFNLPKSQSPPEPLGDIKPENNNWRGSKSHLQQENTYRRREDAEVTTTVHITPPASPTPDRATNLSIESPYRTPITAYSRINSPSRSSTTSSQAKSSSNSFKPSHGDCTSSRANSVSRTNSTVSYYSVRAPFTSDTVRSRGSSPQRMSVAPHQARITISRAGGTVWSNAPSRIGSCAVSRSNSTYRQLPLTVSQDDQPRSRRSTSPVPTVIYDEPYDDTLCDESVNSNHARLTEPREKKQRAKSTISYRNTIGYKAMGTVTSRKGCADFDLSTLNSEDHSRPSNQEMQFYTRSGQTMEVPSSGHRENIFYNELKQVLHQRTSAVRLPRNHSQPAQYRPAQASYGQPRGLRRTPALRHTPSTPQGTPAGNSRTLGGYGRPEGQPRPQSRQHPQYPQQVYHKYPTGVKVARTASLPFGQWECSGPQSQQSLREARRVGM